MNDTAEAQTSPPVSASKPVDHPDDVALDDLSVDDAPQGGEAVDPADVEDLLTVRKKRPVRARPGRVLTPAQAMLDLLMNAGWVAQKVDFARIVNVDPRNVYSYMGDPNPAEKKPRGFIPPSLEKMHGWTHAIHQHTSDQGKPVVIEMRCLPDGNVIVVAEGRAKNGMPFGPVTYRTCYRDYGFKEVNRD